MICIDVPEPCLNSLDYDAEQLIQMRLFLLNILYLYLCNSPSRVSIICRGFPVWLRDVPGIEFRTDNAPFKVL